jgi:hypothetical protein
MAGTTTLTARLPVSLYEQLGGRARREQCTLSALVGRLLSEAVDAPPAGPSALEQEILAVMDGWDGTGVAAQRELALTLVRTAEHGNGMAVVAAVKELRELVERVTGADEHEWRRVMDSLGLAERPG